MTWGLTVISCEKEPNRTRRHDGSELSELTDRRKRIDRPSKKNPQGKLDEPVAIEPRRRPVADVPHLSEILKTLESIVEMDDPGRGGA